MLLFILIRLCRADTFKVGEAYAGFQCFAINDATDGRIFHLRHIKTGAELIAVKTDKEEESFNISFKTFLKNSHGAAHALEHILLAYPSRQYDFRNVLNVSFFCGLVTSMRLHCLASLPTSSLQDILKTLIKLFDYLWIVFCSRNLVSTQSL